MASAAVARFGNVVASRGLRTIAVSGGTPAFAMRATAPSAWAAGKRCKSTVYAESHEYLKKVRVLIHSNGGFLAFSVLTAARTCVCVQVDVYSS